MIWLSLINDTAAVFDVSFIISHGILLTTIVPKVTSYDGERQNIFLYVKSFSTLWKISIFSSIFVGKNFRVLFP